ncbi:MAG: phage tail tape measure protein [Intestinimonas sp.]
MSLESVFKLSLVMNMIDNLSGPMAGIASKVGADVTRLDSLSQAFGSAAKAGAVMQEMGTQIAGAALAPVEATFETRRAIGELASLGVRDLGAVENAARSFSDQWAGTTKADFISAAYDIKSGIASLSDEGVAEFTSLAALTAKATKSTAGEMTSLFATGYGIYKSYYDDLSDLEFGEIFSAGIAESVRAFKTSGSGMAQAIQTLGASATTAQVPLEEQLSVLGMLQATMGGSEAGTKYKAFLRSAAKGGEALGLSFLDANNQLLSMPEILDVLRGKFGETMDAAEKMELQKPSETPRQSPSST